MIKDRIIQIIELKGIVREDFFPKIGMTSANFRGEAKKTPLNSNAIANILSELPDVNSEWLLTGRGEMLKTEEKVIYKVPEGSSSGIPLIPIDAMAGFGSDEMRIMEYECDRYVVPMFRDANYLIAVKGSSMQPKYNSGDLVACRVVPLGTFFQWNKVYVLDTEQGALIKRVKRGSDDNHITLVSENEKYEPFELHLSKVNALAIVVGVLRLE